MNLSAEFTQDFLSNDPTVLGTVVNPLGQTVTYYEHPIHGDEAPVYALIDDALYNTGAYDLDDLLDTENPDYIPVLVDGVIKCFFETNSK